MWLFKGPLFSLKVYVTNNDKNLKHTNWNVFTLNQILGFSWRHFVYENQKPWLWQILRKFIETLTNQQHIVLFLFLYLCLNKRQLYTQVQKVYVSWWWFMGTTTFSSYLLMFFYHIIIVCLQKHNFPTKIFLALCYFPFGLCCSEC